MPQLRCYLNGRFLPASDAALSLDDLGFTQGVTIADRLRTFRQRLFRVPEHLERFRRSCELAYVPQPRSDAELRAAAEELIENNARQLGTDAEWSLAIFATPGAQEPTLGMQATPLRFDRYRHLFETGAVLVPVAAATAVDPRIKHRSRLAWWIAQKQVSALPNVDLHAEPLLTTVGQAPLIRETPTANFLVELDGGLISPPRAEILDGVSLGVIEDLCRAAGIPFSEREVTVAEVLAQGGECLVSNTSFCLAPVARLGDKRMREKSNESKRSKIFEKLIGCWNDLVGVNIPRQFLTNP